MIQFLGAFDGSSIGLVCRGIAEEVLAAGLPLRVWPVTGWPFAMTPDLRRRVGYEKHARVGVHHGFPRRARWHLRTHDAQIGGYVCDADQIPAHWVEECNLEDAVYVPSTFCRSVFATCGVDRPIHVVPHWMPPGLRTREEPHGAPEFRVLTVFQGPHLHLSRKGIPEAARAWRAAFPRGNEPARWRVMSNDVAGVERVLAEYGLGGDPRVEVDGRPSVDDAVLSEAFAWADVLLHAARAEGFGMVPLLAAGCGLPVIVGAHTGMLDYLPDCEVLEARVAGKVGAATYDNREGEYFVLDYGSLAERMIEAFENRERLAEAAIRRAPLIRLKWSRERCLEPLVALLRVHHA